MKRSKTVSDPSAPSVGDTVLYASVDVDGCKQASITVHIAINSIARDGKE